MKGPETVENTADNTNIGKIKNHKVKKKRKAENEEDIANAVKSKKRKPDNVSSELNNSINEDIKNDIQSKEDENKNENKITGKSLRTKFTSTDAIPALRAFVTACKKKNNDFDLADEYLQAKGNIREVLTILDKSDKKNLEIAGLVFSAIQILIVKIAAKYPYYLSSTEETCRCLINTNLSSIHVMLSSNSNAKQRKIALQLLAAIVYLGGSLPRELLNHLSLHAQVVDTLVQQTNPLDANNVRTCFIHFIIAFLVQESPPLTRALLDKRGVVPSIFADLIYDSYELVRMVLVAVKNHILMSSGLDKTTKMHLFSTRVVQNLVNLYNWKGPDNWPHYKYKKPTGHVSSEEKKVVIDALHDFLLTLLTSKRHGIIFQDKTLGTIIGRNSNHLVNSVLETLDRPWEHEKPCDLIVKILIVCPSLMKSQFTYMEPYLSPRVSKNWLAAMTFIGKAIESIDVNIYIQQGSTQLSATQLSNTFLSLCLSPLILQNSIIPSFEHKNMFCRHEGVRLLKIMLDKVQTFLHIAEKTYSDQFMIFRKVASDYILKNVPDLEIISKVWNNTFEQNEEEASDDIALATSEDHLALILDLLLVIRQICASFITIEGNSNLNLVTFLSNLDNLQDSSKEVVNLKVKVIQLLLSVDDSIFEGTKDIFKKVLIILIAESDHNTLARSTLITLLKGVFEEYYDEIEIWVESFSKLKNATDKTTIATVFFKIVQQAIHHPDYYMNVVTQAEELGGEQILGARKVKDILQDLMEDKAINTTKTVTKLQPLSCISTITVSAIEYAKRKPKPLILDIFSHIFTEILHCQVSSRPFTYLIEDFTELPMHKYLISWSDEEFPSFDLDILLSPIIKFLLSVTDEDIDETIFNFETESLSPSSKYKIISYIRATIFCLTQFAQRGTLSKIMYKKCKNAITRLLCKGKNDISCLEECFKWIFQNPVILQYFKPIHRKREKIEKMVTNILCTICIQLADTISNFKHILPFQAKLISQIKIAVESILNGDKKDKAYDSLGVAVDALKLKASDAMNLVMDVFKLPSNNFLMEDQLHLSIWGVLVTKLFKICLGDASFKETLKDDHFWKKMFTIFIELRSRKVIDLDEWEVCLMEYFNLFPYRAENIDKDIFISLFQQKISPTMVKIISFIIQRNKTFPAEFTKIVLSNKDILKQKDVLFPIISMNLSNIRDNKCFTKIYNTYKNKIIKYLTKPVKNVYWIKENVEAVIYLLKKAFEQEVCTKICETILQNGDKITVIDTQYIRLLEALFNRNINNTCSLLNFVHVLIHVMVSTLKKESSDLEKLDFLCKILNDSINTLKTQNTDFVSENLSRSNAWSQFTRFSLKFGLKVPKNKPPNRLLNVLSRMYDIAYKDGSMHEYIKTVFDMATTHSGFLNIMLGSSVTKRDLLELLWTLVRKNNSVMSSSHVPLFLAAYSATLKESDQFILMILQYYENHEIILCEYRPYLYGEAAATHFSVRDQSSTTLSRQPSTSQVFDLFLPEVVRETVKSFPVNRTLQCTHLHEAAEVYDPAFYLPLFCSLLSENNFVAYYKVVQSGALALALIACSSTCSQTRLAAYTIISKFYFHLHSSSTKDKLLWTQFIDALRNGIASLETPLADVRLNGFVSTFLARASLVITEPLHPLYVSLHAYLMAKPALDLTKIPEFSIFLHSSAVEHMQHRHWILEVVRDGLKTDSDTHVALKCFVFKMLFGFYNSCLADTETKHRILEVVESASKIPTAGRLLTSGYALLPWLIESARTLDSRDQHSAHLIASIARNLSHALSITKSNSHLPINGLRHHDMLLDILVNNLKPRLDENFK